MNIKSIITACLFAMFSTGISAQTLSIGFYDDLEEYGDYGSDRYNGSVWECAPFNISYTNSGTQTILYSSELTAMAGKNITALRFVPYIAGVYDEIYAAVKVYLTETNRTSFYKNSATGKYLYFDINNATCVCEDEIFIDGYSYDYCDAAPIELNFDTPFYYSGNNNLVITVIAEEATSIVISPDYANFYESDLTKRSLTFSSESKTFSGVLAGDRYSEKYSVSVINAPVCQFSYENGTAPAKTWRSYVPKGNEDLELNGFEAYQIQMVDGESAKLTRVKKAKANTPLIVCSNIQPTLYLAEGTFDDVSGNMLKVSDGTVTGGTNIYALANKGGVTAFYRVNSSVTIPEGKVYLEATAGAKEVIFIDSNDVNGIETIAIDAQKADNRWFTLDGRMLNSEPTAHGLYIHNGKKIKK